MRKFLTTEQIKKLHDEDWERWYNCKIGRMIPDTKCHDPREGCVNRTNNSYKCKILACTEFKKDDGTEYECPFYK